VKGVVVTDWSSAASFAPAPAKGGEEMKIAIVGGVVPARHSQEGLRTRRASDRLFAK
jgi:hypothetical protein